MGRRPRIAGGAPAPAPPTLVFAYGTLCDPRRLTAVLGADRGWRFGSSGSVQGRLYDTGPYPALVLSDDEGDRVPGVLVELDHAERALADLDRYEGVDEGLYRRERRPVRLASGGRAEAWVYIYQGTTEGLRRIERWRGQ